MASVLLSAFTVCMSVISFLILGDQQCFPVESESHIGWTDGGISREVIRAASTDVHCRWDDTRPCYTTRCAIHSCSDSTSSRTEEKVLSSFSTVCSRLSRQLQVFTLSLDDDVFTLPVASRDYYYSRWRERVLDLTLEGHNVS